MLTRHAALHQLIGLALLLSASATKVPAAVVDIVIQHFAFTPPTATISVGDTVRWTNLDGSEHTVTSQTGPGTLTPSGVFNSGLLERGEVFSFLFTAPGTYDYFCIPHGSSMQGRIIVTVPACGTADFNADGEVGDAADLGAFFRCLAGTCCPTCPPNADFNGDGDVGTDADIESFFRVLAGGSC